MPKWLVLSIGVHNHDPRARTEPLKPKQLTFGDHDLQKTRKSGSGARNVGFECRKIGKVLWEVSDPRRCNKVG